MFDRLLSLDAPVEGDAPLLHALLGGDLDSFFSQPEILPLLREAAPGELAAAAYATSPTLAHHLAVALLQLFVQTNYTGPRITPFGDRVGASVQADVLNTGGYCVYRLVADPLALATLLALFELLTASGPLGDLPETAVAMLRTTASPLDALARWWRARALQVHQLLFAEAPAVLAAVSGALMDQSVLPALGPSSQPLALLFEMECARQAIHAGTEHLAAPHLARARQVSGFEFLLSGALAKRTKFQETAHSGLVVLAVLRTNNSENEAAPEPFALDSDLLLEKPVYESVQPGAKRAKVELDFLGASLQRDETAEELLPIASGALPASLAACDPNDPSALSNLDTVQLLLRYTALRQTTPFGAALVEEELLAVVLRIIHAPQGSANWLVFLRALWERSVLELTKTKTVERGVLQMSSLVDELTKFVDGEGLAAARLRYIHQLPLIPRWDLEARLAERYMLLGALRSAVEIYSRLEMVCEAALCYALVGDEAEATTMLERYLEHTPGDARAWLILGDIRQDPGLWTKAWEVGRYAPAKASLGKHSYKVDRDLPAALDHLQQLLTQNPLHFDTWYLYGCVALEATAYEVAAEAFGRCTAIDDLSLYLWLNLLLAYLQLGKEQEAFKALLRAVRVHGAGEHRTLWRLLENYLTVAMKVGEWDEAVGACRQLAKLQRDGEAIVDLAVVERLVDVLVGEPFPTRLTHFQTSVVTYITEELPAVAASVGRLWRSVARVELWRGQPWAALACHEKAYRAALNAPGVETSASVWRDAVDACLDLVSAYENYGEMEGRMGGVVCADWKHKAKSTIRLLMLRGRASWEDADGWDLLVEAREQL